MSKRTEAMMASAALASILLISLETIIKLTPPQLLAIYVTDLAVVVLFAAEFAYKLRHEEDRIAFLKGHWYEIFAMLPALLFVALEAQASAGAALRSLRVIRVLRVVGLAARFARFGSTASDIIRRSKLLYLTLITASAIFISSVGIYLMEKDFPGSQITNIWEAIWWSINTISTVALPAGSPVTAQGRILASIVIFAGVAFVGIFTSLLVGAIVERRLRQTEPRSLGNRVIREIVEKLQHFEELSQEDVYTLKGLVGILCDSRLELLKKGS